MIKSCEEFNIHKTKRSDLEEASGPGPAARLVLPRTHSSVEVLVCSRAHRCQVLHL